MLTRPCAWAVAAFEQVPQCRNCWCGSAGKRSIRALPKLTERQILAWADAFFAAQGKWPTRDSGPIPGTGETWHAIASAMNIGGRGLRPGSSVARLLARRRGVRNRMALPSLTERRIVAWAKATRKTTGRWPSPFSTDQSPNRRRIHGPPLNEPSRTGTADCPAVLVCQNCCATTA